MGRIINLRLDQPHLWQRVFASALVFIFIGISLLFAPSERTPNANVSVLQELIPLKYHAFVFVGIGISLLLGTFRPKKNYHLLRLGLSSAIAYAIMWLLSLLYGSITGDISSLAIVALWAFMTYMLYSTLKDPGFAISGLIHEVRKNSHGN